MRSPHACWQEPIERVVFVVELVGDMPTFSGSKGGATCLALAFEEYDYEGICRDFTHPVDIDHVIQVGICSD